MSKQIENKEELESWRKVVRSIREYIRDHGEICVYLFGEEGFLECENTEAIDENNPGVISFDDRY